jgi:hypothetical protein
MMAIFNYWKHIFLSIEKIIYSYILSSICFVNFSEQCCIQDKLEMLNATNNLFRWKHQRYYAYREFVILGHVSFLCYVFFCFVCLVSCVPYATNVSEFHIPDCPFGFLWRLFTSYCYTINDFSCDACRLIIDIILFYI